MLSHRIGERGRIIGITIVITTLYLLLQQVWLGVTDLLSGHSFLERPSAAELEQEAKKVAEASQNALQNAPASSRPNVLQLGFYLGFVSQAVGSYAMSAEAVQAQARQLTEPSLLEANRLSQILGLGPVTPLTTEPSTTLPASPTASKRTKQAWPSASPAPTPLIITTFFCWECTWVPKRLASRAPPVRYLYLPALRSGFTRH